MLDDGLSRERVAEVLFLDDDAIRNWHGWSIEDGLEGLTRFEAGGGACQLSGEQQAKLAAWVKAAPPRSTRRIGAFIAMEFGVVYESRPGLIALLHRLELEFHKPEVIPRKLDEARQRAFIVAYEKLLNFLPDDEAALFSRRMRRIRPADAVHPAMPRAPPAAGRPKQEKLAISPQMRSICREQTSGRQRINIHRAIDFTANAKHLSGGNRPNPDD